MQQINIHITLQISKAWPSNSTLCLEEVTPQFANSQYREGTGNTFEQPLCALCSGFFYHNNVPCASPGILSKMQAAVACSCALEAPWAPASWIMLEYHRTECGITAHLIHFGCVLQVSKMSTLCPSSQEKDESTVVHLATMMVGHISNRHAWWNLTTSQ